MVVTLTRDRRAERREAEPRRSSRPHGSSPGPRPGWPFAPGCRPQDRDAAAIAVLVLRFQAGHLRRHVRPGQQATARTPEASSGPPTPARRSLGARVFVEFSAEDVERYQLLFQRTIPLQPSPRRTRWRCRCSTRCARVRPGGVEARGISTCGRRWWRAVGTADSQRPGRRPLAAPGRRGRRHVRRPHHDQAQREGEQMTQRSDDTASAADVPRISHREAMVLAETEFGRMTGLLRQLRGGEWQRRTICPLWDVQSMVAHVLGMAEAQASFRQFAHDYRSAAKRDGGLMIDAMTAAQVRERAALTPAQLADRLAPSGRAGGPGAPACPRAGPLGCADEAGPAIRPGTVAVRLPRRLYFHAGHLDAPARHRPRHRRRNGPHPRARWPYDRRRRGRVGAPPRPALRARPCPGRPAVNGRPATEASNRA